MRSRWPTVRIVAFYAAFASAWIVASDLLTGLLPAQIEESVQTIKGLAFVGVTALVLYLLIQPMYEELALGAQQARSAEILLRQVIDTVPVGVLFVNDDAIITFLNPGAERLLALRAEESVGQRLDELCCPGAPDAAARVGELLRTGSADGMRLGAGGASARAFVARAQAVDPAAGTGGWVVALADITESHLAAERLERLVDSYRFLAGSLVLCGRANDPATLLEQVVDAAVQRGGYRAAWAILRRDVHSPYEDVALVGLSEQAAETARRLRSQALGAHDTVADSLLGTAISVSNDIARDPAQPWYSVAEENGLGSSASFGITGTGGMRGSVTLFAALPGHFDAEQVELLGELQGALTFAFGKIGLDRERLLAEEALDRSERGYRELFVTHPMPLWVFDLETLRFLAVNDAAVHKYGWTREEFLAMTIADIRPPGDVPVLMENIGRVSEGFEDSGIWTHTDRSGRAFPVHIMSHTTEWDGHAAEIVMAQEVARMG